MKVRPTAHLWSFLAVLGALWYAATSQNNAVAYLFFFVVLAVACVSVVHGAANLRNLKAAPVQGNRGYAGRPFAIAICLINDGVVTRRGLSISWRNGPEENVGSIEGEERLDLIVGCKEMPRGCYGLEFVTVRSSYPFGIVAFSVKLPVQGVVDVYPEPRGIAELPCASEIMEATATGQKRHGDDFAGFRAYRTGDSQRHVDWRAVARNQPMHVKQFEGAIGGLVMLRLNETPGPDLESKLSQLSLWVHEAARLDMEYGLVLDDREIEPSKGEAHQHATLRALARYPA